MADKEKEKTSLEGLKVLPDEEQPKLILHFDTNALLCFDTAGSENGVEGAVNTLLSHVAWGAMDNETGAWVLKSESPSLTPPEGDTTLCTYADFVRMYVAENVTSEGKPSKGDSSVVTESGGEASKAKFQKEAQEAARQKLETFCLKGQPGDALKFFYDSALKNLSLPLAVRKRFGVEKVDAKSRTPTDLKDLDINPLLLGQTETGVIEEANTQMFKPGFWRINNAFFTLINVLTKEKRKFAIVLHATRKAGASRSDRKLLEVLAELNLFCSGEHLGYNGQNRTKAVKFNGEKGTSDLRVTLPSRHCQFERNKKVAIAAADGTLLEGWPDCHVFMTREALNGGKNALLMEDVSLATGDPLERGQKAAVELPAANQTDAGDSLKAEDSKITTGTGASQLLSHRAAREVEAPQTERLRRVGDSGPHGCCPLVLIDTGNVDSHNVVFLSKGKEASASDPSADPRDCVTGGKVDPLKAPQVDVAAFSPLDVALDSECFLKAVRHAEANRLDKIKKQREATAFAATEAQKAAEENVPLKELPASDYLYRTVLPALHPALESVARERPEDPLSFIAFHLLRYGKDGGMGRSLLV
uniref:Uncharacterized protein n=1 Tax=Chromera velia CCMP2878 TaxID=1169474 RepID=A0A0G4GLF2_9ALVE|eukprot:Cvel_22419.t1-p1 / transcript=Cvel_22419.t1 / gene=Cvel_22419 / organism=Chromera_velia_CCMP2878 / gene_product=hypothetical protein / transcript_product=hypothetical protein / location=Cvel_scaffold2200:14536-19327(+) / protein_length=587 / sequence_SO=supercontig / SO=protein_coding / is_pseudo=false